MEEVEKLWKSLEEGFNSVSTWLDVNTSNGPLVMGDSITYGDTVVAALLMWPKVVLGEDSDGWKTIMTWNGGRWARLSKEFEKYEIV